MAIFGWDRYGLSLYGGRILVDYGVAPFTARPLDYRSVHLEWSEPTGDWTDFRLLKSGSGFAANENDGVVLFSRTATESTIGTFIDNNATPGWTYYTIYLRNGTTSEWQRAAVTHALVPYDYGSAEKIFSLIPQHYKVVRPQAAGFDQQAYNLAPSIYLTDVDEATNEHLQRFVNVLGWGMDILRTQIDTVLDGHDVGSAHVSRVGLLAEQFGYPLDDTLDSFTKRNLVKNLALLHRKRGTADGIRELITLSTGLDVDVYPGPNLMLNQDQAEFVSPQVARWEPGTRYVEGDRVEYQDRYFEALQTAYGAAQKPPDSPTTSNAYWTRDTFVEPQDDLSLVDPVTGSSGTWQAVNLLDGLPLVYGTRIGVGAQDPLDTNITNVNALSVKNTTEAVADLLVRSVPKPLGLTTWDGELIVKSGIPVPEALPYVAGEYRAGDVVLFEGAHWEALTTTSVAPSTPDWQRVSIDDRPRLAASFYAHGHLTGTAGTGGAVINPWVGLFGPTGDLLHDRIVDGTYTTSRFYDAFQTGAPASAKALDLGGTYAASTTANWGIDSNDQHKVIYPTSGAQAVASVAAGIADAQIDVTFGSVGTRELGIMFRRSDASNYWEATQSGLYRVVAGVRQTADATWTSFVAGDKMKVMLSGNNISVYKNGTAVASIVNTFNATATEHGLIVEA